MKIDLNQKANELCEYLMQANHVDHIIFQEDEGYYQFIVYDTKTTIMLDYSKGRLIEITKERFVEDYNRELSNVYNEEVIYRVTEALYKCESDQDLDTLKATVTLMNSTGVISDEECEEISKLLFRAVCFEGEIMIVSEVEK